MHGADLEKIFKDFSVEHLLNQTWRYSGVGAGWGKVLEAFVATLSQPLKERLHPIQVKEKFGGLRLYMYLDTANLDDVRSKELHRQLSSLVRITEEQASKTCELCGKPGSLKTDGGWWLTLCKECGDERKRDEDDSNNEREAECSAGEAAGTSDQEGEPREPS